jgi:hypothetical protein
MNFTVFIFEKKISMNIRTIAFIFLLIFVSLNSLCQEQKTDSLTKPSLKPYSVPNTDIVIVPPAHFKYVDAISGFIHVGTSASITIQEIDNISYLQITEGLTPDYFAKQNATVLNTEDVKTMSGMTGKLYTLGFSTVSNDTSKKVLHYERLMLFTGDYQHTIWVSANYPELLKKVLYGVLKESLLTVNFKQNND